MTDWNEKEINFLKENYHKLGVKELSKVLNRSMNAIYIKLSELKISKWNVWTEEEEKLLIQKYEISTTNEIMGLFPRHSLGSINKKADKLGLIRKNISLKPSWSDEEKEKLKNFVSDGYDDDKISVFLNRGRAAVSSIRRKICRETFEWSENEINILKNNYNLTNKEICKLLPNKTISQISKKIKKLNLQKEQKWYTDEKYLIKLFEQGLTVTKICKLTKRNEKFILKKIRELGYSELLHEKWSENEINILKNNYLLDWDELLLLLNKRTKNSVQTMLQKMKLKRPGNKIWSEEEKNILINNYSNNTYIQLKILLPNKTNKQIKIKAKGLNLTKNIPIIFNLYKSKSLRNKWRKGILKRDDFTCQECNLEDETGALLDCHHIIPKRILNNNDSRLFDINNGICLCKRCHKLIWGHELEFVEKFFIKIGAKND